MKPLCILESPLGTRSGYGDMSRDIARWLINLDKYEVKLISMPWGSCPINALDADRDRELLSRIAVPPVQLDRQPDLFIQVTIPNEFRPVAKYNIGITAGIESDMCSKLWIEGCNRMDLVLATSVHSANVLKNTRVQTKDQNGNVIEELQVTKPIDILPNCVPTSIFKKIDSQNIPESINELFYRVPEKFCFLFVGHWLKGGMREDRKNIALLIHLFCETFKNIPSANRPALVLKTSGADFSILDREEHLQKIKDIRAKSGPSAPNVYLLHGDLSEEEINGLYNHPKVKVHVSLTKGEGFGRPLLEASLSQKPIITSGWSGHLDFLNPDDAILIGGDLKNIEPGAVWENILIPESRWFNVDETFTTRAMLHVFKNYEKYLDGAKRLAKKNADGFNFNAIQTRMGQLLDQYAPKPIIVEEIPLVLPTLKKLV